MFFETGFPGNLPSRLVVAHYTAAVRVNARRGKYQLLTPAFI